MPPPPLSGVSAATDAHTHGGKSTGHPDSEGAGEAKDEDKLEMRSTMLAGMAGVMNVDLIPDEDSAESNAPQAKETEQQRMKRQLCENGCVVTLMRQISGEPSKKVWLELKADRVTFRSLTRIKELTAHKAKEDDRRDRMAKKNADMEEKRVLAEKTGKKEKVTYTKQVFVRKNLPDRVKDCTLFIVDIEDGDDGIEQYTSRDPEVLQKFQRDANWAAAIMDEGSKVVADHCLRILYRDYTTGTDKELCCLFDTKHPDTNECHPHYTPPEGQGLFRKVAKVREKKSKGRGGWGAEDQRNAWYETLKRLQFGWQGVDKKGKEILGPSAMEAFEMSPMGVMTEKIWVFADEDGGGLVNTSDEVTAVLQFCNIELKRKKLVQQIFEILSSKWGQTLEEGQLLRQKDDDTVKHMVDEGEVDLSKAFLERLLWKLRGSTGIVDEIWSQFATDKRMKVEGDPLSTFGFDKFLDQQDGTREFRAKRQREEKRIREAFAEASEGIQDKIALEQKEREMRQQVKELDQRWRMRRKEREKRRKLTCQLVKQYILRKHKDELSKGKFTTFLMHSSLNSAFSPWCCKDWVWRPSGSPSEWTWDQGKDSDPSAEGRPHPGGPRHRPTGPVDRKNDPPVEFADLGECPWDRPLRDFYISTSVNTAYGAIVNPIERKEPKEKPDKEDLKKQREEAKGEGDDGKEDEKKSSSRGSEHRVAGDAREIPGAPWDQDSSYYPKTGPLLVGATKFLSGNEAIERVMTEFNPRAIHIGVGAMPLEKEEEKFFGRRRQTAKGGRREAVEETFYDALKRMVSETDIWPFKRAAASGEGKGDKWWKLVVGHRDMDKFLDHWSRAERGQPEGNYPQDFSEAKHSSSFNLFDGKKTTKAYRRGVPFRKALETIRENAFFAFCDTPFVLILEVPDHPEVLNHVATEVWDVLAASDNINSDEFAAWARELEEQAHREGKQPNLRHRSGPHADFAPLGLRGPWDRPQGVDPVQLSKWLEEDEKDENRPKGKLVTPEDCLRYPKEFLNRGRERRGSTGGMAAELPPEQQYPKIRVRDLGGMGNLPLRLLRNRIILGVKVIPSATRWQGSKPEWSPIPTPAARRATPQPCSLALQSPGLFRLAGLEFVPGNARGPSGTLPADLGTGVHPVQSWDVLQMPLVTKMYEEPATESQEPREVVKLKEWEQKWSSEAEGYSLPYPPAINWPRAPEKGVFPQKAKLSGKCQGGKSRDEGDARSERSGATTHRSSHRGGGGVGAAPAGRGPHDEQVHKEYEWRRDESTLPLIGLMNQIKAVCADPRSAAACPEPLANLTRPNSDYVVCWTDEEVAKKLSEVRAWQKRMASDERRQINEARHKRKEQKGYLELMPADEDLPQPGDFVNQLHSWTREHLVFVTAKREASEKDVLELRSTAQKDEEQRKQDKRGYKYDKTYYHRTGEFKGQRNPAYSKWAVNHPEDEYLSGNQPGILEAWSAGCQFVGIEHLPDPNTIDGQHGIMLRSIYRSKFRMSFRGASGYVLKPTHLLSVPDKRAPPRVPWDTHRLPDWFLRHYKNVLAEYSHDLDMESSTRMAHSLSGRRTSVSGDQLLGAMQYETKPQRPGQLDIRDPPITQEQMDAGKRWRETGPCNFTVRVCAGHFLPPQLGDDEGDGKGLGSLLNPREFLGPIADLFGGKGEGYNGDVVDPFVEVRIDGVEADCAVRKTRTIQNNGYCPVWNDPFTFAITEKEHAILTLTVYDDDSTGKKTFLCRSSVPLAAAQLGMRCLFLFNENEKRISSSPTMLVELNEVQAGDETQKRRVLKTLDDQLEQNKIALREKQKQLEQLRDTVANQGKQLTQIRIEKETETRMRDKYHRAHCVCDAPKESCVIS
eukprot:TRINITY_DN19808_c0_g1_i2.p1 TRINITY_DN19808_c0_g1~~TRINITY_DN19808_c0_g1_i2.p1  ORF type:complete len:1917 (+),score=687.85 TRINITY_DN19808_c0_g1_i2:196-5751(+)